MSAKPPIVGFTGYATAGKDTAAMALQPHGYTLESFAKPLKELALFINPWICLDHPGIRVERGCCDPLAPEEFITGLAMADLVNLIGWEKAKKHSKVRELLQRIGQWHREQDEQFWVNQLARRVGRYHNPDSLWPRDMLGKCVDPIVITDIRYDNEAEWIRDYGGKVIEVIRPGLGPVNGHSSESGVSDSLIDHTVVNSWGKETLWREVQAHLGLDYINPEGEVLLTEKDCSEVLGSAAERDMSTRDALNWPLGRRSELRGPVSIGQFILKVNKTGGWL